jgi:hypothetical protein
MWTIEQFCIREEIEFFHKSDVEFIVRSGWGSEHEQGLIVEIRAVFTEVNVISLDITGVTGSVNGLETFVQQLQLAIEGVNMAYIMADSGKE